MGNFYPLSKIFLDFLNWKKSKNTKNSLNTLKYSYIVWIQKPQNNRNKWFKECFEKIFISQILNLLSRFRCDWLRLTLSHTKNSFPRFLRISKAYSCFNWRFCFRLNPGSFISHLLKLFFFLLYAIPDAVLTHFFWFLPSPKLYIRHLYV